MRDGKKEFKICKEACKNAGCHCPEEHIFHGAVANTLMFIRAYYYAKGWEESKDKTLKDMLKEDLEELYA